MKPFITLYKPESLTPLQMLTALQKYRPEYMPLKLGYAGRLDPMAKGLLLVLVGEENKNKEYYENLDKEYVAAFILGVATDTYDGMGMITHFDVNTQSGTILHVLQSLVGKWNMVYPSYSSIRYQGKPLFWYARNSKEMIPEIRKDVTIHSLELMADKKLSVHEIAKNINNRVHAVRGDFRQQDIMRQWQQISEQYGQIELRKITVRVSCSSGTYIRSLINTIGQKLTSYAMLYTLERTRIGSIQKDEALSIPRRYILPA